MSDWSIDFTYGQPVVKDGCGVFGIIRKPGAPKIPNQKAVSGLSCIKYRGSSLGAGYACFDTEDRSKFKIKAFVKEDCAIDLLTAKLSEFLGHPLASRLESEAGDRLSRGTKVLILEYRCSPESEAFLDLKVDEINFSLISEGRILGRIFSYGRSVSVFKEVGYPLDVATIFGLDKENSIFGDVWIAHTRQPTNSPGSSPVWSHPFCAMDCAIVHNGDISSFGANLEFLNSLGFKSHVGTDSEVIARLLNYLIRQDGLTPAQAARIITNPFEEQSERFDNVAGSKYRGVGLDGPFAVVAGFVEEDEAFLIALTDRSKFRPLVVGEDDQNFYVASEETQIRTLSKDAAVWAPEPGEYFIASAKLGLLCSGTRRIIDRKLPTKKADFKDSIDAAGMEFSEINENIRQAFSRDLPEIAFRNLAGQRFIGIGTAIARGERPFKIKLEGNPGNCLANLNDGAIFEVHGNCADDLADTMHCGRVIVHGSARDVCSQALQGGDVLIRGSVGNRAAIQMREYRDGRPFLIVGGTADDYLGEYMAGGIVMILNLSGEQFPVGKYIGTGMVGGTIYIRGRVDERQVGLPQKKADILNYLEAEMIGGEISSEILANISALDYPSEMVLQRMLPEKVSHRVKSLFFRGKYTKQVSVEYRPLSSARDDNFSSILQKMEDFFNVFEIPTSVREQVLESEFTVIRTIAEVASETPIPPQELPVEE